MKHDLLILQGDAKLLATATFYIDRKIDRAVFRSLKIDTRKSKCKLVCNHNFKTAPFTG